MNKTSWVTVSGIVSRKWIKIVSITLVANATGAATVDLYKGQNATAEPLCSLTVVTSTQATILFPDTVELKSGLYCNLGSNVTGVLVVWN